MENISYKWSKFIRNTISFLLISAIPKFGSIILIPLCTSILTTSEYGEGDIIVTAATLMTTTMTLCVSDGVFRYIVSGKHNKNEALSVGIIVTLVAIACSAGIVAFVHSAGILDKHNNYLWYGFLCFAVMSINRIEAYYHKGDDNTRIIKKASVVQSISLLSFTILFLVVLKIGLQGYLLAVILSYVTADVVMLTSKRFINSICCFSWNRSLAVAILSYSIPMVFSAIAWWINNVSDRYILLYLNGPAIVGVYAVSSKIPSIVSVLYMGIINAFQISTISDTEKEDGDGFWKDVYESTSVFLLAICMILIVVNIWIAKLLFSKDFFDGWRYAPILICAAFFKSVGDMCLSVTMKERRSGLHALIVSSAAVLNIIGNIILIPKYSAYGAAFSTLGSFFLMWFIAYTHASRYFSSRMNTTFIAMSSIFLVGEMLIGCFGSSLFIVQVILFAVFMVFSFPYIKDIFERIMHRKETI